MPDQSSAADEHALLQEITAPLATLPDDPVSVAADVDFPTAFRGYDRLAVDAYVKKVSQLVAELRSTRSPEAAVRRALERVGEQISGILQRAHETAEQITTQSRREAEGRLVVARQEAAQIAAAGEQRVKDLDADADRIWAERLRIVEDARELASQLLALTDAAAERFPPAEEASADAPPERPQTLYDAEGEAYVAPDPAEDVEGAGEEPEKDARGSEPGADESDDPDPTAILPPAPSWDDSSHSDPAPPELSGPAKSDAPPPDDPPRRV
jgi:hypothetical protein